MDFIESLTQLKDFLEDRPSWAFLALSLSCNGYLFRKLEKARAAHMNTVTKWLPMVEQLARVVNVAAAKARSRVEVVK